MPQNSPTLFRQKQPQSLLRPPIDELSLSILNLVSVQFRVALEILQNDFTYKIVT